LPVFDQDVNAALQELFDFAVDPRSRPCFTAFNPLDLRKYLAFHLARRHVMRAWINGELMGVAIVHPFNRELKIATDVNYDALYFLEAVVRDTRVWPDLRQQLTERWPEWRSLPIYRTREKRGRKWREQFEPKLIDLLSVRADITECDYVN
jgi:phytoene dehydrogenase-like protein